MNINTWRRDWGHNVSAMMCFPSYDKNINNSENKYGINDINTD